MNRRSRISEQVFPGLCADGYAKHSRACRSYNCVAFAAGDFDKRWDGWGDPPDGYWPTQHTGGLIEHLVSAYRTQRFEECAGPEPEPGYEKVALYFQESSRKWTHAARLREDGWWESKLGEREDIVHRMPQALIGALYGQIALYMKRRPADRLRFHLVRWLTKKRRQTTNEQARLDLDKTIKRFAPDTEK